MSLLRRRMITQRSVPVPSGFEYVYDAADGGLPTDDGWELVRLVMNHPAYSNMTNVDGVLNFNINHGNATAYIYLPNHEQAENCSFEIECAVENTSMQPTLCDSSLFAQAGIGDLFYRKFSAFPTDSYDNGNVSTSITPGTYYTIKVVKENNICSFSLDGVDIAPTLDCKPLSQMTAFPTEGRTSIRFSLARGFSYNSSGVVKIKKITYREW